MAKKLKKYVVNIYFQSDVDVTISAHNRREALSKASKKVAGRKIGRKAIDRIASDVTYEY